ncbi:MAG: zf-HC2 domain-containing protein, partial [Planctomycetota bacterium]
MSGRCPGFGRLCLFADGELGAARRREVADHVSACAGCSGRLAEIRMLDAALAGSIAVDVRRRRMREALLGGVAAVLAAVFVLGGREVGSGPAAAGPVRVAPAEPAPSVPDQVRALVCGDAPEAAQRVRRLGPPAHACLRRLLRSGEDGEARAALRLVCDLGDRGAATSIVTLLDRPGLEFEAVVALGELADRRAVPALSRRFREGGPAAETAIAIGRIGGASGRRALEALLGEETDSGRRALLIGAMGAMEPALAAPALAERLD